MNRSKSRFVVTFMGACIMIIFITIGRQIVRKVPQRIELIDRTELLRNNKTISRQEAEMLSLLEIDRQQIITAAKKINSNPVLVSLINHAYLPLAFSWLCKTESMNIHEQVLIITTKQDIKDKIYKISKLVNVVVISAEDSIQSDQFFNHVGYLRLMIRRTQILNLLVQNDIETLLFEFDFLWIRNPIPLLHSYESQYDMLFVRNYHSTKSINGGFIYMFPSNATKSVFNKLTSSMLDLAMRIYNLPLNSKVPEGQNDQDLLSKLVREKHGGLKSTLLPYREFADGIWYEMSNSKRKLLDPYIIHNDYILGNKNKINRMKKWGHWFVKDDSTCDHDRLNKFSLIS